MEVRRSTFDVRCSTKRLRAIALLGFVNGSSSGIAAVAEDLLVQRRTSNIEHSTPNNQVAR